MLDVSVLLLPVSWAEQVRERGETSLVGSLCQPVYLLLSPTTSLSIDMSTYPPPPPPPPALQNIILLTEHLSQCDLQWSLLEPL